MQAVKDYLRTASPEVAQWVTKAGYLVAQVKRNEAKNPNYFFGNAEYNVTDN